MDHPLRIIGVADLHGHADQLFKLKNSEADLIAFCGDLHNSGTLKEARPVAEALASLGPPVLIVPGNMDPKGFALDLWQEAGLTVLHGKSCLFEEIGFMGFGGMAINNPMRIGDLNRFYLSEEDVYKSLANANLQISGLPRRVVLSHQPPRGVRDAVYSGEAVGCIGLRRFVDDFYPDLLICGHIHEDRGQAQVGPTTVVNVGELRRGFASFIELGEKIKIKWIEP
jgi:Icc-related predicted phosphoesterase